MSLGDNNERLQGLFSMQDQDLIPENLNTGLNDIAKKFIVKKRIERDSTWSVQLQTTSLFP